MSILGGRAQAARQTKSQADQGMTLVELIVAMGILTVIIAVFMGGVLVMTRDTARAQAVADAGDEVRRVNQRFDRDVRYASGINRPGFGTSGAYYVEYLVSAVAAGEHPQCTQWRLVPGTKELQRRVWDDDSAPDPTAWLTVASRVRNNLTVTAQRPFQFTQANAINGNQRLRIVLDVGPARAGSKGALLDSEFVARNTNTSSATNKDADNNGVTDSPVCQAGVGRP